MARRRAPDEAAAPAPQPAVLDRVRELRRVRAADLLAHPANWRRHPPAQRAALERVLASVGFAGAALAREDEAGRLVLIDGHLRADMDPEFLVPTLVLDVSEQEAELLLATYDPIGDLAETNAAQLAALMASIAAQDEAVAAWLPEVLSAALPSGAGFHEYAPPQAWSSLAARFLVPPFSILDARQGYWQERKRAWLALGLQSELGRDGNANKNQGYDQIDGEWLPGVRGRQAESAPVFGTPNMNGQRDHNVWASDKGLRGKAGTTGKNSAMNRLTGRLGRQWNETRSVVSIFDPVLCELAYRWFCPPGGLVVDPCAGGSVRGVLAGLLGRRYRGVELRPPQVEANREQWAAIDKLVPKDADDYRPAPTWVVDDGRNLKAHARVKSADFALTSPPYGDLEIYSDDPRDLSTMTHPKFCEAHRAIVAAVARALRPDRFACWVVGDFRDETGRYRGFVAETIAAFQAAGLALYNDAILATAIASLPLRVAGQFTDARKLGKTHQNVLVFVKGDARKATEACGVVEVEVPPAGEVESQA